GNAEVQNCKLQMEQTVDMVIDVERALLKQNGPIPKPKERHQLVCDGSKEYLTTDDACLPLDNVKDQQFTLRDVFGRAVRGSCPLDEGGNGREQVCLNVPEERGVYLSEGYQEQKVSKSLRCYALKGLSRPPGFFFLSACSILMQRQRTKNST